MSDYMVHTEVNHFEGWLGNEHDLNTMEEARAEMLRQEKAIRAEIKDGLYVMGEWTASHGATMRRGSV